MRRSLTNATADLHCVLNNSKPLAGEVALSLLFANVVGIFAGFKAGDTDDESLDVGDVSSGARGMPNGWQRACIYIIVIYKPIKNPMD